MAGGRRRQANMEHLLSRQLCILLLPDRGFLSISTGPSSVPAMAELAEHSPGLPVLDLKTLGTFQFSQILSQSQSGNGSPWKTSWSVSPSLIPALDSITGSIYLRGTIHEQDAIIHLQRTVLPSEKALDVIGSGLAALNVYLENKPVRPLQLLWKAIYWNPDV